MKTRKGNENSCSKAQEELCTTLLSKENPPGCASQSGNGGMESGLQWKILAG